MQAFIRAKHQKRRPKHPIANPWIPLKEQPNLIFRIIDQQAKEIHPPVVWYNGRFYYELKPGVLAPMKEQEVLMWQKKKLKA